MTPVAAGTELLDLAADVEALLRAHPNLDVHVGEVEQVTNDPDGKAHPYAVLWVSPGRHDPDEQAVCGDDGQLLAWTFQVTCAGGDVTRCLWAVQQVNAALLGERVATAGRSGRIRFVMDPGPVRLDRDVTPHRSYVPLMFTVDINQEA